MPQQQGDPEQIGSALVNASEVFPDLERLKADFDVIYFLDLCAGIEAAVLYDELHLTTIGPGAAPILEPLAEAGVLHDARVSAADPVKATQQIMRRPRAAELMARVQQAAYLHDFDRDLAITAKVAAMGLPLDLAIEEDTGMTLVMPFRQLPIYLSIPSVTRERNAVYDAKLTLAERYQELSASMLGARSGDAVHDLDQLALPPIALQTLSRASTFDELGEVTLEQRSRYEPIRKRFRELREIFASEHYGWRERYAKKAKLDADRKRLSGIVRYVPTLTEFVGDAEKMAEALAPMMITHDFSKGGKLIPPFAKWFDDRLFKFRVRPLVGLVEFYTDASVREIATASRVLFRHELTSADVERARSYVASVGKYVPKRRHTSSPDPAQTVKPPKNE